MESNPGFIYCVILGECVLTFLSLSFLKTGYSSQFTSSWGADNMECMKIVLLTPSTLDLHCVLTMHHQTCARCWRAYKTKIDGFLLSGCE